MAGIIVELTQQVDSWPAGSRLGFVDLAHATDILGADTFTVVDQTPPTPEEIEAANAAAFALQQANRLIRGSEFDPIKQQTIIVDVQPTIQVALDAAAGGVASFTAGKVYTVTAPLTVSADTVVDLNGATIKAGPGFVGNGLLKATGVADVAIINGELDGNKSTVSGAHNLRIEASTGIKINRLRTVNAGVHGVWITGACADISLRDIDAYDNGSGGVMLSAGLGATVGEINIVDVRAYRNGRSGIDLGSNGYRVNIDACHAIDNVTYGIYADGGEAPATAEVSITDCVVMGNFYGVAASDATNIALTGNRISGNQVGVQGVNLDDSLLALNWVHDNALYGVNSDVAGPYLADPPAGVSRDSNPTLYRTNDQAKKAYRTPSRNMLFGNHIFNNGTGTPGPGVRIKNGRDWQFAFNHIYDDQAAPTQTKPIDAFMDVKPSFPAWASGTAYAAGALVSDGSANYQALTAHTAGATTEPGVGANWQTNWVLSGVQPWATAHSYAVGDWAWQGGDAYVAKSAHTSDSTTQPGTGASWQTVWTLQVVTLDGFVFGPTKSFGHRDSNSFAYTGSNPQVDMFQGSQSRYIDQAKFLADVFFGNTWKIQPIDAANAVNIGWSTITSVILGNWQSNPGTDQTLAMKRAATATSGAPAQRSSRITLETSQWTGSAAASKAPKIAANGASQTDYWIEIQDDAGAVKARFKADGKGLFAGGIGVGNSAAAASLGALSKKVEIFDASGNSLGFVPVYASIT